MTGPTVALIHATSNSIAPALQAFSERFPQARVWNLLDDLLIVEADAAGGLTPPLRRRMHTLIAHAVDGGADAVLLTCSMYGPAAYEVASRYLVPVLASDHALFEEIAASGAARVAVLGPLDSGLGDTVARLRVRLGPAVLVTGAVVAGATEAAAAGDRRRLDELVTASAREVACDADLVALGQFSLSSALAAARAAVDVPVLAPPQVAVDALRGHLSAPA